MLCGVYVLRYHTSVVLNSVRGRVDLVRAVSVVAQLLYVRGRFPNMGVCFFARGPLSLRRPCDRGCRCSRRMR